MNMKFYDFYFLGIFYIGTVGSFGSKEEAMGQLRLWAKPLTIIVLSKK